MSVTPRRKSERIKRSKSRTKKVKRFSSNSIRSNHPHSHTTQPHRYSHGVTPAPDRYSSSPHILNSINGNTSNGFHGMDDSIDFEDSPPPSKATHKKNAVSSFLSIFQTFSQSK